MAKKIFVDNGDVDSIVREIRLQLENSRYYGNIEIKRPITSDGRRAYLSFSQTAWIKIASLVAEFKTEVQWHGLVERISENVFHVYDIIVPPHTVSAATVTSDQQKYTEWLNALDDETFNDLRFHGHSHVDMAVAPSATDTGYRTDIVSQLPKPTEMNDVYYIFMIINKRHEWSAQIFDLSNNALYNTNEVDMIVTLEDGSNIGDFVEEAKKVAVSTPVVSPSVQYGSGGYWKDGKFVPYGTQQKASPSGASASTSKDKDESKKKAEGRRWSAYYDGRYDENDEDDDDYGAWDYYNRGYY